MTESEFWNTKCDNHAAKITFKNGTIAYGVITTFFGPHDDNYYLVKNPDLHEYARCFDKKDDKGMKRLANPVNLDDIAITELYKPQSVF